jgi:hypothetical protein
MPPARTGSASAAAPASSSPGGARPQRRLEKLAHDREREVALELGRPRGQHDELVAGALARPGQHARLADAGRAFDQHAGAVAGARALQRPPDGRELALALLQRRLGEHRHGRSLRRHAARASSRVAPQCRARRVPRCWPA